MSKLLHAVEIFGNYKNWNSTVVIVVLVAIQALIALLAILLIVSALRGRSAREEVVVVQQPVQQEPQVIYVQQPAPQPEPVPQEPQVVFVPEPQEVERELTGISLDLEFVQREFTAGDALNHDGLVVTAHYNTEPLTEDVTHFITVIPPDMSQEGKPTVTVKFQDKTVGYQIMVNPREGEPEEPQPDGDSDSRDSLIIQEESLESILRYDRSFTARLIQSDDETKIWYTELKNELLSYRGVKSRISWKRETFKCHKEVIAKIAYRGKTMCIFFPLNPYDYPDEHAVEDASDTIAYSDTPLMMRLKSYRRIKVAEAMLESIMEKMGEPRVKRELVDYYVPYEGVLELINKGLIKREVKTPEDEKIFQPDYGVVTEEEDSGITLEQVAQGVYVTKVT